jgi:hypothetical protein
MHYFSNSSGPGAVFVKKHAMSRYTELVFWHPMGSAGHEVHSGVKFRRANSTVVFHLKLQTNFTNRSLHYFI